MVEETEIEHPVLAHLSEQDSAAMKLDGFDSAILGYGTQFGRDLLIYSLKGILEILEKDMSPEEAQEYYEFNIAGAWVGDHTPVIMDDLTILQTEF